MKLNNIDLKVNNWAEKHAANGNKTQRDSVRTILQYLYFLEKKLYFQHEPSQPPNPAYWKRLEDWLNNFSSDVDQQLAFELAAKLFFVGRDEIRAMYRSAFLGPIMRWLVTSESLTIIDESLSTHLEKGIKHTWFCPITDSMKINEFIHINDIRNGINNRPDWLSLTEFGCKERILGFINKNNIERIVLLEDYIATGEQAGRTIQFASNICSKQIPLLVVPLIQGYKSIKTFEDLQLPPHVTIDPVLLLKEKDCVLEDITKNSPFFNGVKNLAEKTYPQVTNEESPDPNQKPYHPLGFRQVGGLLILGTNTPDNTLPMIYWKSTNWVSLFPRHSRI